MSKRLARRAAVLAFTLLLASAPAAAHDFWLEPASFHAEPGAAFFVRARIGHPASPEVYPRDPGHVASFDLVGPAPDGSVGRWPLLARAGADPAGWAALPGPGVFAVGYRSRPNTVSLAPHVFAAYLREKGLDARPVTAGPAREVYVRSAKALVRVGSGAAAGHDRVLGLPLELVPAADPFRASSAPLTVTLLHRGAPLADVQVEARSLDRPHDASLSRSARTDRGGRVHLVLPVAGRWLLTAVHLERAPSGAQVDWQSQWASLTFEVPPHPE